MILRRRFEENRSRFAAQMEDWGKAWEAWREEITTDAHDAHDALGAHLIRAENRLEAGLADLRAKRSEWQNAIRQNHSQDQIRALRRSIRKAQRSMKAALSEWEAMLDQYSMTMAPVAA
jgi:dGTP triphosphohydrolase